VLARGFCVVAYGDHGDSRSMMLLTDWSHDIASHYKRVVAIFLASPHETIVIAASGW